jgi:hypothetical protein
VPFEFNLCHYIVGRHRPRPFVEEGRTTPFGDVVGEHFQRRYPIITSLVERMHKYSRRGVTIVDAPVGEGVSWGVDFKVCALDWVIKKYHRMESALYVR